MNTITINLTLATLDYIINSLEKLSADLHKNSVDSYPYDVYKEYDSKNLSYLQAINYLSNIKALKEIEIGFTGHNLNVEYQTLRVSQLEKFYIISTDNDRNDIGKALSNLQTELIQNKYRRENSKLIMFDVELPKNIATILHNYGFIKIDTNCIV
jgi:ribosomal protein S8